MIDDEVEFPTKSGPSEMSFKELILSGNTIFSFAHCVTNFFNVFREKITILVTSDQHNYSNYSMCSGSKSVCYSTCLAISFI